MDDALRAAERAYVADPNPEAYERLVRAARRAGLSACYANAVRLGLMARRHAGWRAALTTPEGPPEAPAGPAPGSP